MAESSSSASASATDVAFLQRRVALAGLVGAIVGGGFLAFRVVLEVTLGSLDDLLHPSMSLHAAAVLTFVTAWLSCNGVPRSLRFVRGAESAAFFCASLAYSLMGYYIPALSRPELIVALALTLALVARAVYVPSTPRRTFLLTTAAGLPLLAVTFAIYYNEDLTRWASIDPGVASSTNLHVATIVSAFEVAWWAAAVLTCTLASRVIYGLRREVQSARKLGQYVLEERIGSGGMGIVYRASHSLLRRPTAIKLLPPDKMGARSLARFEREVRLTAQLSHPNTITIFDYGRTPEGVFYYAMELLEGATLMEVVRTGGPLPAGRVIRIIHDVAGALAEAHAAGVIHRDIKPANIMLCERGGIPDVVKVLDFGLVKELDGAAAEALTHADAITGTPQYMAPEAISAPDSVDARSDLYALGAVAYFLLTGHHVFEGNSVVEVCSQHLHGKPIAPSERAGGAVPADLEALVMSCLAKLPGERPNDASELAERLLGCADARTWTVRDARAWWAEHGPTLSARRRSEMRTISDQTIAIDLAHRKTEAS